MEKVKVEQIPGWVIAVALVLIAVVFGHTAFFARTPFEVAGLRFGPVLATEMDLANAVVAFARSRDAKEGPCPRGWVVFEPAGGRTIVGAGSNSNTNEDGTSLRDYPAYPDVPEKAVGGSETHMLTVAEMPAHSHVMGDVGANVGQAGGQLSLVFNGNLTKQSSPAGEGKAHNNMQPFVALFYCVRKP